MYQCVFALYVISCASQDLPAPHSTSRGSEVPRATVVTTAPGKDDPESLYRDREDHASAKRAAALWAAAAASDFEAAWKLSRVSYWLGTHAPEAERRAALERGVSAGEAAARLGPDRPEGHFWLAADMGQLAESFGIVQALKYRSRIKSELERVRAIDPFWQEDSADSALGQWYFEVPRLLGGDRAKAEDHLRRVLDRFPDSQTALSFLAEVRVAEGRTREARALLQRVIAVSPDPDWAPEGRDFQHKAAGRLKTLEAPDR
jgi:tetratricopeptide (TPR) repeat protein